MSDTFVRLEHNTVVYFIQTPCFLAEVEQKAHLVSCENVVACDYQDFVFGLLEFLDVANCVCFEGRTAYEKPNKGQLTFNVFSLFCFVLALTELCQIDFL